MSNTALEVESLIDYDTQFDFIQPQIPLQWCYRHGDRVAGQQCGENRPRAVWSAPVIVIISQTDTVARFVAKYRTPVPVHNGTTQTVSDISNDEVTVHSALAFTAEIRRETLWW